MTVWWPVTLGFAIFRAGVAVFHGRRMLLVVCYRWLPLATPVATLGYWLKFVVVGQLGGEWIADILENIFISERVSKSEYFKMNWIWVRLMQSKEQFNMPNETDTWTTTSQHSNYTPHASEGCTKKNKNIVVNEIQLPL